ncbi:hypothetical protein UPYG_G00238740 [Umbra pygmaea]|uniref:Ubiquitin-like domain-containing protein n=1 Tax=Umbra pygmaea TaxID=75934 RepID=A0ABD0WJQ3_UMBPY
MSKTTIYQVIVLGLTGERNICDVANTEKEMSRMTVQQLKKIIIGKLPKISGLSEDSLKLMYTTKMMEDTKPLSSYYIHHLSVIQLVAELPG